MPVAGILAVYEKQGFNQQTLDINMHERLEALKPLLKAGEYEKASEALKRYCEELPDDWDGRLMEGIVAHLRGDEKTFHRIHGEAQAVIDARGKEAVKIKTSPLWKKYHSSWKKVAKAAVIGFLVAGTVGVPTLLLLNRRVWGRVHWIIDVVINGRPSVDPLYKYGGPKYIPKEIIDPKHDEPFD